MNDMMVNGSGIKDPTAYKAIRNSEGGQNNEPDNAGKHMEFKR